MKKVAISGYFDPIHVGHLEYIEMLVSFLLKANLQQKNGLCKY